MAEKLPLKADTTNGIIRDFETGDFVGETKGGTAQTTYVTGDMLYASAADTLSRRAIPASSTGYLLCISGGLPTWNSYIAPIPSLGFRVLDGNNQFGNNDGRHLRFTESTGAVELNTYLAGNIQDSLTIQNSDGATAGTTGNGVRILFKGNVSGSGNAVSFGRVECSVSDVTGGAYTTLTTIAATEDSGTDTKMLLDGENERISWMVGNGTTASTLTSSLMTLSSGVSLTLTSGALTITSGSATLTSGNLTMNNGVITVKKATAGAASAIEMYNNQGTGATSDAVQLRAWISDTAGTPTIAGSLQWLQTTATVSAQTAAVILTARVAGTNTTHIRVNGGAGVNFAYPIGINLATLSTTPARNLEVVDSTNPQFRFTQAAASVYGELQITSASLVQLLVNGSAKWTCNSDGIISRKSVYCTADRTTTSSTLGDVTDLSIPLKANSKYFFKFFANTSCNNASGNQYAVQYSAAGATVEATIDGTTTAVTARMMERISAFNTAATAMNTVNGAGSVRIEGMIETGANAGNLTIQSKVVTATTTTCTIRKYACLAVDQISP